jgi:hypothetical protein
MSGSDDGDDVEVLIEPDESFNGSSIPGNSVDQAGLQMLSDGIRVYSLLFPHSPATLSSTYKIELNLLRDFLPLAMQCSYGFLNSPILLNIEIVLTDFNWNTKPFDLVVKHPIYGNAYVGQSLVATAIAHFFSPGYHPQHIYRSHSRLVFPPGTADPTHLASLKAQGYDEVSAIRALLCCENNIHRAIDFLKTGDSTYQYQEGLPDYGSCQLLYLVLEIADSFLNLSDHCCMCGDPMPAGIRPWVCSKELCVYQHSRIGVGNSVSQEIRRDPLVADLMVSVFSAALGGGYLGGYPHELEKIDGRGILAQLPAMETISKTVINDEKLTSLVGADAVQLLRWILMSNRSHLISLARPSIEGARFQFLTLLASPEAEIVFEALKKEYGSFLLWHGSPAARWHAIIRQGLKNYSNTDGQLHGAVRGPGIYLAQDSSTSIGYTMDGGQNLYVNSVFGRRLHIMALCEVAKVPSNDTSRTIEHVAGRVDTVPVSGFLKCHSRIFTLTMEPACIVRSLVVGGLGFAIDSIETPPAVLTLKQVLDEKAREAL